MSSNTIPPSLGTTVIQSNAKGEWLPALDDHNLCTRANLYTNTGGVNDSPNREGNLRCSMTENRDPLCLFVEDPHIVGGDTGKPCVTAALPVPYANVLAGAPFPLSFLPYYCAPSAHDKCV